MPIFAQVRLFVVVAVATSNNKFLTIRGEMLQGPRRQAPVLSLLRVIVEEISRLNRGALLCFLAKLLFIAEVTVPQGRFTKGRARPALTSPRKWENKFVGHKFSQEN